MPEPNEDPEAIKETLKKAAAALRDAEVPFMLAGGMASWARGGPESDHDLDFALTPDAAERALDVLEEIGMKGEKPPEGWLYKAWDDNNVLVDLIFEPAGHVVTEEMLDRSEVMDVNAIRLPVMAADDIVAGKLLALDEHHMDYPDIILMTRALREQLHWDDLRERTKDSVFARAFFTMAEGLGIVPEPGGGASAATAAEGGQD